MAADRLHELQAWVAAALGPGTPALEPASADASFRCYFRTSAQGRSYVVMDAPPSQGDCRPFLRVAAATDFPRGLPWLWLGVAGLALLAPVTHRPEQVPRRRSTALAAVAPPDRVDLATPLSIVNRERALER